MTSVCDIQKDSIDINSSRRSKVRPYGPHGNGLTLYPVSVNKSGEGLPYAPEDFPNPGDKWRWKVGKRIAISGYFVDRYVYLPRRLCQHGRTKGFASRLSLEQYVREKFPNTDVRRFLASFIWKIPSKRRTKDDKDMFRPPGEITEDIDEPRCKAGNKVCSSLNARNDSVSSRFVFCDICCEEPGFCRDCCCILCCRVFDKAYSYVRCEANVEGSTCGHSCHVDCALRAYMAGTVGGSIGLDAEYYCRRCDSKTDLVSYVTNLLENCESVASRDDVEKILGLGICLLRGSQKTSANELLRLIELAMSKFKNGTYLEDIWKEDVTQDIADRFMRTCESDSSKPTEPTKPVKTRAPKLVVASKEKAESSAKPKQRPVSRPKAVTLPSNLTPPYSQGRARLALLDSYRSLSGPFLLAPPLLLSDQSLQCLPAPLWRLYCAARNMRNSFRCSVWWSLARINSYCVILRRMLELTL